MPPPPPPQLVPQMLTALELPPKYIISGSASVDVVRERREALASYVAALVPLQHATMPVGAHAAPVGQLVRRFLGIDFGHSWSSPRDGAHPGWGKVVGVMDPALAAADAAAAEEEADEMRQEQAMARGLPALSTWDEIAAADNSMTHADRQIVIDSITAADKMAVDTDRQMAVGSIATMPPGRSMVPRAALTTEEGFSMSW